MGEESQEEEADTKHKEHHHEKPQEYQGKIMFFKQSIPIKRLMERSLSETMQTPPEHTEASESEQDHHIVPTDEKKEGAFGGIRGLFSKQLEPSENKPQRIKSLKDVLMMNKQTKVKEHVVSQL